MRKLYIFVFIVGLAVSCNKSPIGITVSKYKPVLVDKNTLANSVIFQSPSDLRNPGKYLIYGNYLYVVEKYKGVHIFNNTNPFAPKNTGFISIPGVEMISTLNNVLYADNATDMVSIDINDPAKPVLKSRIPDILPQPGPPDGLPLDAPVAKPTWPTNSVVVNWVKIMG